MSDPVNHPIHYTNSHIECIDAIEAAVEHLSGSDAFLTAQCIKYLWRWKLKENPVQDLEKCRWYLDRLIEIQKKAAGQVLSSSPPSISPKGCREVGGHMTLRQPLP